MHPAFSSGSSAGHRDSKTLWLPESGLLQRERFFTSIQTKIPLEWTGESKSLLMMSRRCKNYQPKWLCVISWPSLKEFSSVFLLYFILCISFTTIVNTMKALKPLLLANKQGLVLIAHLFHTGLVVRGVVKHQLGIRGGAMRNEREIKCTCTSMCD